MRSILNGLIAQEPKKDTLILVKIKDMTWKQLHVDPSCLKLSTERDTYIVRPIK